MKILEWILRIALGGGFVLFSLLYFLDLMPKDLPPMSDVASAWIKGLAGAPGYLTMVKCVELVGGVLVLSGCALPLGLLLLAPVVINIVYFNTVLSGAPNIDIALLVCGVVLAGIYRTQFYPLFTCAVRARG